MSLDEQVRWSLLNYPSLYDRRIDVLHFRFCINRSSYEWQDGELVDPDREPGQRTFPETPVDPDQPKWMQDLMRKVNVERRETWDRRRQEIDDLCASDDLTLRNAAHPIEADVHLLNIPDDVRPDWLEGAKQVIEALYRHEPKGQDGHDTPEAHDRNLKRVDEALAMIHARFGREPDEARCFREWKALRALESLVSYKDDDDLDFNGGRPGEDFGSDDCWRATLYGEADMLHVFACDDGYDDFLVVRSWTDDAHRSEESRLDLDGMIEAARSFAAGPEASVSAAP